MSYPLMAPACEVCCFYSNQWFFFYKCLPKRFFKKKKTKACIWSLWNSISHNWLLIMSYLYKASMFYPYNILQAVRSLLMSKTWLKQKCIFTTFFFIYQKKRRSNVSCNYLVFRVKGFFNVFLQYLQHIDTISSWNMQMFVCFSDEVGLK